MRHRNQTKLRATPQRRRQVEILSGGCSEDEIAAYLGCSVGVLRRLFADELKHGPARSRAAIIAAMKRKAATDEEARRLLLEMEKPDRRA